ncbi:MAG: transcription elongation factor GreA [Candidatus Kapabacteria bacterium]|nr:transcription elongation factor GreA [Ignavibacteriota bacterium]MCW5884257.1 transcription elongation factor GreA [Candidatus Kapabacteria bacterium]
MSKTVYMTKERIREIEQELQILQSKGRMEVARKIAEARSHGDLSENADYDAAKDEQGLLELKISKLSELLANSQIISADEFPNDKVYILSKVKVRNENTGKILDYQLVSSDEADFERNKISVLSPMGKSLMGKSIGEKAEIIVPSGKTVLEILEIYK